MPPGPSGPEPELLPLGPVRKGVRQRHGRRRIANKKSFDLLNEIADRLLHARKADPSKEDTGRIAKAGKQVGS